MEKNDGIIFSDMDKQEGEESVMTMQKKQFKCDQCESSFKYKNNLTFHKKTHLREFFAPIR